MVGTVDYIAPEVFEKAGYTETVDFWSLGTILFEMLLGYPPFCGKNPSTTLNNVLQFEKNFKIPNEPPLSPEAVDLMRRLITRADKRLGRNGVQEIKNHPFFRGINWREIRNRPAPIIPKLSGDEDTRNFDKFEMTSQWAPVLNPNSAAQRNEGMLFIGYSYKKPVPFDGKKEIDEIFERLKKKKESDGKRNFSEDRLQSHFTEHSDSGSKVGSNSRLLDHQFQPTHNFLKKAWANEYTDKGTKSKITDAQTKSTMLQEEGAYRSTKLEGKKQLASANVMSSKILEKFKISKPESDGLSKPTIKTMAKLGLLLPPKPAPLSGQIQPSSNLANFKRPAPPVELSAKPKPIQTVVKQLSAFTTISKQTSTKPASANPLDSLKAKTATRLLDKQPLKVVPTFLKATALTLNKKGA